VLEMLGAKAGRIVVVGCQPASLEEGIGLSEPVAAAVDGAIRVVTKLVADNAGGAPYQPAADGAGDVPYPPAGPQTARSGPREPAAGQEP
jgi:hypothetical protein